MMISAIRVQILLLFASRLVQTTMRMAMGPLLFYVCEDLHCATADLGQLLSAFSLGYVATQVLGGALADKVGPKVVITLTSLSAGVFLMESGRADSVAQLWRTQAFMGACQGPLFPTSIAYLSPWLLPEDRAFASTALDTGITVGSMIALPFSGMLSLRLGWRGTFQLYGVSSVLYAFVWAALATNEPAQCSYITKHELRQLREAVPGGDGLKRPKRASKGKLSISSILTHASVWAIFLSHMAFNAGVYFTTSWAPIYYSKVFGTKPEDATLALFLPPLLNLLVKACCNQPLGGWLRNSCNCTTLQCRRAFSVLGFLGSGVLFLVIHPSRTLGLLACSTCFALVNAFTALHPAGFKANYMDISLFSTGLVSGVGNTLASLASFAFPLIVAHVLQHYESWALVFMLVAIIHLSAACAFGTLSSVEPIDRNLKDDDDSRPLIVACGETRSTA
eukprot:TRINITY_DN17620_c0_g1_i1.p1 TRINITY_DN17620_c0_g1~~TRINITY_DN17620_c0_g1_i1.p1  ORF type:complete len:464 (+),score=58.91 TRINITY_DN17620_c0_g1_i1:45-1394(+)